MDFDFVSTAYIPEPVTNSFGEKREDKNNTEFEQKLAWSGKKSQLFHVFTVLQTLTVFK